MVAFIRDVVALLEGGEDIVIVRVVDSSGSTPRSSGAKMAVRRDGRLIGTVGGGLVEADACNIAAELLEGPKDEARIVDMDLTSELAAGTDMICGGKLTLCLERIAPESQAAAVYKNLGDRFRQGDKMVLVTRFHVEEGRCLDHLLTGDAAAMEAHFSDLEGAKSFFEKAMQTGVAFATQDETVFLAEGYTPPPALYLLGAGHVSCATGALAATVGFRVVVVDDRADFANAERFPAASEIRVIDSFENAFGPEGPESVDELDSIVIVTRGHLHDKIVLGQALKTPARYVGMIGSTRKRNAIYEALMKEGVSRESIARCHSPIGLSIGAQTPEEIAVSIVAELIADRAGI